MPEGNPSMSAPAPPRLQETILNLVLLRGLARWATYYADEMEDIPRCRRRLRPLFKERVARMQAIASFFEDPLFDPFFLWMDRLVDEAKRPRLRYGVLSEAGSDVYHRIPMLDDDPVEEWVAGLAEPRFFGKVEPTWQLLVSEFPDFASLAKEDVSGALFVVLHQDNRFGIQERSRFNSAFDRFLSGKYASKGSGKGPLHGAAGEASVVLRLSVLYGSALHAAVLANKIRRGPHMDSALLRRFKRSVSALGWACGSFDGCPPLVERFAPVVKFLERIEEGVSVKDAEDLGWDAEEACDAVPYPKDEEGEWGVQAADWVSGWTEAEDGSGVEAFTEESFRRFVPSAPEASGDGLEQVFSILADDPKNAEIPAHERLRKAGEIRLYLFGTIRRLNGDGSSVGLHENPPDGNPRNHLFLRRPPA